MNGWTLGPNDSDLVSWVTTLAYFVVATLCYARTRVTPLDSAAGVARSFWFGSALLLAALGFNKQLDLQTPLIELARQVLTAEGWYAQRQVLRGIFLGCLTGTGLVLVARLLRHSRLRLDVYGPMACGFLLLLTFIIIRAWPVEHVRSAFGFDVSQVHGKRHLLELAGVLCIGVGAATASRPS